MRMYVGNLPYSTNEDDLKDLFGKFGEVVSATIIRLKDTGRSKGFGFVEMTNKEMAETAISELNGQELDGRKLVINEAHEKPPTNNRGRFNR